MPVPAVCRMVHYVSYGTPGGEYQSACRAAVITEMPAVDRHAVYGISLCVLNPTGLFFNEEVHYDEGSDQAPVPATAFDVVPEPLCNGRWYAGGTWHWPERVPELSRMTGHGCLRRWGGISWPGVTAVR